MSELSIRYNLISTCANPNNPVGILRFATLTQVGTADKGR